MKTPATAPLSGLSPEELARCDREPIHTPGLIQPYGALVGFEAGSDRAAFASRNVGEVVGRGWDEALGRTLPDLLGEKDGARLAAALAEPALEASPTALGIVRGVDGRPYLAIGHAFDGRALLEFDATTTEGLPPFHGLYPEFRGFLARLGRARTLAELLALATVEVRRITGFDRVLAYRFDRDGHGTVIAEDRNDRLPAYLGLRFPSTDIPAQARELYRANRLRIIGDVDYIPVPIEASRDAADRPLDLTFSSLRSVSPVHVEYMRNMGTGSSMSISIVVGDQLWGLISCHHRDARLIPFELRTACDLLGRVLSLQLEAMERRDDMERRIALKSTQTKLLSSMARQESFIDGLVEDSGDLLSLAGASGAAILFQDHCSLVGSTPPEEVVRALVAWLAENGRDDVHSIDSLPEVSPAFAAARDVASGVLAISISKLHNSYVLWFRPEVIRTIDWAGDPAKPFQDGTGGPRLHPRRSFRTWRETVSGTSLPWQTAEVDAAVELRNAIVGIVLLKAEELAELANELKRSNRELEAFSYSVSHDLRAPFRHIVGYSELLLEEKELGERARRFVGTIIESARFAGTLVDNLLSLAQMGRTALHPSRVDMNRLIQDVRRDLASEEDGRDIEWVVADLPGCVCDTMMMKLAVRNLLSNAVKYTRERGRARIEVGVEGRPHEWAFFVRDNGVGFDMKYVDKLFGVFQRLHRMEEYEGTGIGLANVQRIVERHGGRAWAEGRPDEGATFWFTLPRADEPRKA